jgi:hypothetical protein
VPIDIDDLGTFAARNEGWISTNGLEGPNRRIHATGDDG